MNRLVCDTSPHHEGPSVLRDHVADNLRQRHVRNSRISQKRQAKNQDIQVGNLLLINNRHAVGKFWLPFEPVPWTVSLDRGTLITAQQGSESLMQNMAFSKQYLSMESAPDEETSDSSDIVVNPREVGLSCSSAGGDTDQAPEDSGVEVSGLVMVNPNPSGAWEEGDS
ncbi:hypothetical protein NDU88_002482 [Pleurodeles waltl]|uniref:Uncharacterized protein n=1 Tax=Pleurodeles waltl TaxID=8319 RepID=A0AAV7M130_PLEWA|nr:hypothetical protein NDU88_002482 [Pleurodeles waltl]